MIDKFFFPNDWRKVIPCRYRFILNNFLFSMAKTKT